MGCCPECPPLDVRQPIHQLYPSKYHQLPYGSCRHGSGRVGCGKVPGAGGFDWPFPFPLSLGGIAGAECTDPGLARPGFLDVAFLGVEPFSADGCSAACAPEGSAEAEVSAWACEDAASWEVSASGGTAGPCDGGAASLPWGFASPFVASATPVATGCVLRFDRLFPSLGAMPDIGRAKAPLPMRGVQTKRK